MFFPSLLDKIHLLQSFFFVTGGFFLPVECLPVFICQLVWMLTRYHDYCVLSEITETSTDYLEGCKVKQTFSESVLEWYRSMGIPMSYTLSSNLVCTALGINIYVSLYRISKKHNFPLLYSTNEKKERTWWSIFVFFTISCVVICEGVIHFLYESRKNLPDCSEKLTPVENIYK